ncbi:MAG: ribosomal protein S18-alanine N-acetyltransferase [Gammaproteobacteria bacterium]
MNAQRQPYALESRPMREEDIATVAAIERGAYSYPWTEGIFLDCLRVGYWCRVFEQCGVIDAYGILSVAAGECHILNLCVRAEVQGRGIGRKVLAKMLAHARQQGADSAFLEVRPSNLPALRLYRHFGFNEVGIRRRYYPAPNSREDAIIMALSL